MYFRLATVSCLHAPRAAKWEIMKIVRFFFVGGRGFSDEWNRKPPDAFEWYEDTFEYHFISPEIILRVFDFRNEKRNFRNRMNEAMRLFPLILYLEIWCLACKDDCVCECVCLSVCACNWRCRATVLRQCQTWIKLNSHTMNNGNKSSVWDNEFSHYLFMNWTPTFSHWLFLQSQKLSRRIWIINVVTTIFYQ